ncbi:MAG: hypothetical protein ACK2U6_09340 [Candidatus Promineifilaceae bacterium]
MVRCFGHYFWACRFLEEENWEENRLEENQERPRFPLKYKPSSIPSKNGYSIAGANLAEYGAPAAPDVRDAERLPLLHAGL